MPETISGVAGLLAISRDGAGLVVLGEFPSCGATGASMDVTAGVYAPGCIICDQSTGVTFRNTGSTAVPAWSLTTTPQLDPGILQTATVDISAANIVATGAGQFGHANGVILVAAPGAGKVLDLIDAVMDYKFAVAAYTAGGNITINWGAGGAAITGLVSAANSVGAASDKVVQFKPLAAAGNAMVANAPLNLVSTVAFTQPGTAAGTIRTFIRYRVLTLL